MNAFVRDGVASAETRVVTFGVPVHDSTLITLRNASGMEVKFLSLGGIVLSIIVPDRDGNFADVVLGYDDLSQYLNDKFYFGALVGRSANRIANSTFAIAGTSYELTRNDGRNHLHGGTRGFSHYEWKVAPFETDNAVGAELSLRSPHGDQGYPGNLEISARYTLSNSNEFLIEYRATTDASTPVNLTQHAYFNLTGCSACPVLDHELRLSASRFTPVDSSLIPTGELRDVEGTPFDFREARRIGDRIDDRDAQIQLASGYDHNFVIDGWAEGVEHMRDAASLYDSASGRLLNISTTKAGIQVYTGNELEEVKNGKGGAYVRHAGVALETQSFPDAPNHDNFPSTLLAPGNEYYSATSYQFAVVSERAGT